MLPQIFVINWLVGWIINFLSTHRSFQGLRHTFKHTWCFFPLRIVNGILKLILRTHRILERGGVADSLIDRAVLFLVLVCRNLLICGLGGILRHTLPIFFLGVGIQAGHVAVGARAKPVQIRPNLPHNRVLLLLFLKGFVLVDDFLQLLKIILDYGGAPFVEFDFVFVFEDGFINILFLFG